MQTNSDASPPPEWPSDWMRAALGILTLQALEGGPSYGYAIISALEASGIGTVKGGTLYPLLSRFESAGLVTVEWRPGAAGPGRKYFALTDLGHRELEHQRNGWIAFTKTTTTFLASATTSRSEAS